MPPINSLPWYDRFFRHEYLKFDEHPETDLEIEFLLRTLKFKSDTRILDIGCGYGRHALPISQKGYSVFGIDRSPVMLSAAQSKNANRNLRLLLSDMRSLPFSNAFHIALSLFSSFGYFQDEDENFQVLQQISSSLLPGGQFLIETANRDFIVRHLVPTQVYRPQDLVLIEERTFDAATSRSQVDITILQNGEETRLNHSIRLYTYTELQMLLAAAGLVSIAVWGDYRGNAYTYDSPQMITLAEKL